jgi:hypothetical protein
MTTIVGTVGILFFKNIASLPAPQGFGQLGGILAACINAAFITFMNVVYTKVAEFLNNFGQYRNALLREVFFFCCCCCVSICCSFGRSSFLHREFRNLGID